MSQTFVQWLQEQAVDFQTGTAVTSRVNLKPTVQDTTHYRMDGGKLQVQESFMDEFLREYAEHLALGRESISLVERRTPVYKMHFDLDFLDYEYLGGERLKPRLARVLSIMSSTMRSFYTESTNPELLRAYVLQADMKVLDGDAGANIKTGIHVIYPNLRVTTAIGLTLRKACVLALIRDLKRREAPLNSWEDVLDKCVHVANGLRMLGAVKCSRCQMCIKASRMHCKASTMLVPPSASCDDCRNFFKDQGRPYKVLAVIDGQGNEDAADTKRAKSDHYYSLKNTSIRCSSKESSDKCALPPGVVWEESPDVVASKDLTRGRSELLRRSRGDGSGGEMPGNDSLFTLLEEFIRNSPNMSSLCYSCDENPYSSVFLKKIVASKAKASQAKDSQAKSFICNVEGPGSKYCLNVGREHGSSSIYFVIGKGGLRQRCFSNKSKEGGCKCSDFTSPPVKLPADVNQLLFGSAKPTKDSADGFRNMTRMNMSGVITNGSVYEPLMKEDAFIERVNRKYELFMNETKRMRALTQETRIPRTRDTMYPNLPASSSVKYTSLQVDDMDTQALIELSKSMVPEQAQNPQQPEDGEEYGGTGARTGGKRKRLYRK